MFCKDKWVIMQLPLQLLTSHLLQLKTLLFYIRTMPKVLNDIDHHYLPGLLAQVVPSHASDFHLWGSSPSINTYPAKKKMILIIYLYIDLS